VKSGPVLPDLGNCGLPPPLGCRFIETGPPVPFRPFPGILRRATGLARWGGGRWNLHMNRRRNVSQAQSAQGTRDKSILAEGYNKRGGEGRMAGTNYARGEKAASANVNIA